MVRHCYFPPTSSVVITLSCVVATSLASMVLSFPPCKAIETLRGNTLPMDPLLFYMPPDMTYMNAATLGPMARPCLSCAVTAWETLEADRTNRYPWESNNSQLDSVRRHAAKMLLCLTEELALVPSTTVALNLIGEGLVATGFLRSTDRVLTTDQEHPGGVAVWNHMVNMGKLAGVDRVALPVGDKLTPNNIMIAFSKSIQEADAKGITYRVVCVSHVLTTTGARLPLLELSKLAHKHGALLVVDGAQGPGNIAVNLHEIGADAYTVSAHKWLLAPTGSGLLYIHKDAQQHVQPAQLAGGSMAYSQHAGTVPLQTIAGLGYSLDLLDAYGGLDAAETHGIHMAIKTRNALTNRLNDGVVSILSPTPGSGCETSIVTISLPTYVSNDEVTDRLKSEFGVVVKKLPDQGSTPLVNCIRVSHHVYTTRADVDKFVNGLASILEDCRVEET